MGANGMVFGLLREKFRSETFFEYKLDKKKAKLKFLGFIHTLNHRKMELYKNSMTPNSLSCNLIPEQNQWTSISLPITLQTSSKF